VGLCVWVCYHDKFKKFNQLEMVTTFSYKPSLVRIYARSFELSW